MKDLAIYGAGGLGREFAVMVEEINNVSKDKWNIIGFFDDGKTVGEDVGRFGKVLGGFEQLNSWPTPLSVALCFGAPGTLWKVSHRLDNPNLDFPNFIHPTFYVGDKESFKIGKGNIITGCCVVTVNVEIGDFNLFNGWVTLGHDVKIGNCNALMPNCRLSGEVKVADRCLIGSGAFVLQQLKLQDDTTVGPLSALVTKPKKGATYIGNPAKMIKY